MLSEEALQNLVVIKARILKLTREEKDVLHNVLAAEVCLLCFEPLPSNGDTTCPNCWEHLG
jgi:hypothetical protein